MCSTAMELAMRDEIRDWRCSLGLSHSKSCPFSVELEGVPIQEESSVLRFLFEFFKILWRRTAALDTDG